jgi:hypothetical protein
VKQPVLRRATARAVFPRAVFVRVAFACAAAAALSVWPASTLASGRGTVADIDAAARAAGNRPAVARAIGTALFATTWPVQVTKVRVDGVGSHDVAGLVLSGVKFHGSPGRSGFLAEVVRLVESVFATPAIEEVDLWTTVPLKPHEHAIVSGDLAMPTSRTVFAVTVTRAEAKALAARLRDGRDVFWDAAWRASLGTR